MSAPLIETSGLGRDYEVGGHLVRALAGLDVRIERGEFVAVMGPSGSGKSTCMQPAGMSRYPDGGQLPLRRQRRFAPPPRRPRRHP